MRLRIRQAVKAHLTKRKCNPFMVDLIVILHNFAHFARLALKTGYVLVSCTYRTAFRQKWKSKYNL